MCGLSVLLAFAALGFLLHHRYSGSIHLHVQNGHGLAEHDRQVQLHGFLNLFVLLGGEIFPGGLGDALHGFGGHLQTGQHFHLFAAVLERRLLANQSVHATDSRRELRVLDIEFDIAGELALVTVRAQIVRARDGDLADDGHNFFGPQFAI